MSSKEGMQGGKAFGILKAKQEEQLEELNKEFLNDPKYNLDEDLEGKLEIFKRDRAATGPPSRTEGSRVGLDQLGEKFMEFDLNDHGDIDMMSLKRMLEKLGASKTHLELKKMIGEVTRGAADVISYRDFVQMMLGKQSAILKIILMYEEKAKEKEERPAGPPSKKRFADLP